MARKIPEVMIDVVIAEAIGEGTDGLAQVAQVMFNRADSRGQTLEEVVTAPKQFEGYKSPGRETKKSMDNKEVRAHVRKIIEEVDSGARKVKYPNADHFHAPTVRPKWSRDTSGKVNKEGNLGGHIFYSSPLSTKAYQKREAERATQPSAVSSYAPTPPKPTEGSDALKAIEKGFGTSRSPFTAEGRQNLEESRSATLSYNTGGAKRNLTVKQTLENDIIDAVTDVYGPDYSVSVISGRQQKGVSKGMVGSRRHTHAAADVHVYDGNGERVAGDDLVPLAQHWLADGKGSVGFPAKAGQSMHIDHFGGEHDGGVKLAGSEGKLWYYGNPTSSQRKLLSQARDKRVGPSVMAKDAPVPPAAGSADAARRARLTQTSTLNTPEESNQAAIASTGNPRIMATLQNRANKTVAAPVEMDASQGDPDIMAQFSQEKPADKPLRPRKRDEIEGPMIATPTPTGTQAPQAPAPETVRVAEAPVQAKQPVSPEGDKPNVVEQAYNAASSGFAAAQQRAQDAVAGVQDRFSSFVDDPANQAQMRKAEALGTFRNRVGKIGERVQSAFKPLGDFLDSGPDYSEATQSVDDGWRDDGFGSNVVAIGPQGTRRVNLSRSDTNRSRDRRAHPNSNMEVYRANKAVFDKHGLEFSSANSKKLMEMGETLYVPKEREAHYEREVESERRSRRRKRG